jgi:hypothetical protein
VTCLLRTSLVWVTFGLDFCLSPVNTPYLFVIGTTWELATLPEDARPIKPGQSAIALCRAQIDQKNGIQAPSF